MRDASEVLELLEVTEMMRCVLLCMLEAAADGLRKFRGFEISIVAVFSLP